MGKRRDRCIPRGLFADGRTALQAILLIAGPAAVGGSWSDSIASQNLGYSLQQALDGSLIGNAVLNLVARPLHCAVHQRKVFQAPVRVLATPNTGFAVRRR